VVIQWAWIATHLNGEIVNKDVNFIGGDSGANKLTSTAQNLGCCGASNTHALNDIGTLYS
jgi:hypothetical protein